jgi:tRNA(Ile)-lysidine synthase
MNQKNRTENKLIQGMHSFLATIPLQGESILIGYSGGVDSTVLLHLLNEQKETFGFQLHALHVNHGLRGQESNRDARFCKKVCAHLGIPLENIKADVAEKSKKEKCSLEEAGRDCRRELLKTTALKNKCRYIFLAHTLDDQIETLLFRLFRGTGLYGLKGIVPVRKEGPLIFCRPLLAAEKKDLIHWAVTRTIPWREDASNLKPDYSRNRIRHELIPLLQSIFKNQFPSSLLRLSEISQNVLEESFSLVPEPWKQGFFTFLGTLYIDLFQVQKIPLVLFIELLRKSWLELFPEALLSDHGKCEQLYALCFKTTQKQMELPGNIHAFRDRNFILISGEKSSPLTRVHKVQFSKNTGSTCLPFKEASHSFYRALLQGDRLSLRYAYSPRLDKKRFSLKHLKQKDNLNTFFLGKKNLKDLFSEKKVPLCLRKSLVLLYYNRFLVLIPGVAGKNDFVKNQGPQVKIKYE